MTILSFLFRNFFFCYLVNYWKCFLLINFFYILFNSQHKMHNYLLYFIYFNKILHFENVWKVFLSNMKLVFYLTKLHASSFIFFNFFILQIFIKSQHTLWIHEINKREWQVYLTCMIKNRTKYIVEHAYKTLF